MISLEKKTILYTLIIILVYIFVRYYYYQGNESKNNFLNTDIIQNNNIGGKKDVSALVTNLISLNTSVFGNTTSDNLASDLAQKINNKINETKNNQIDVENKFNKLVDNMINEIIFDSKKKINNVSYDIMYNTSKF